MDKFFILASASPRRQTLLKEAGQNFKVIPSTVEEVVDKSLSPKDVVKSLALQKAQDVFNLYGIPTLGADTVVVFDGKILGKPENEKQAIEYLKALSGNVHEVITGVAVITKDKVINESVTTKVYMNVLTDDFINDYVSSGKALDKAGAYGVQDGGFVLHFDGSLTNVIGLPMEKTKEILKELSLWQLKD